MPFQAHEHLFRTMPGIQEYNNVHHRSAFASHSSFDYSGNRQHEACRHESFITFIPSASGPFYKCELCGVYMNADSKIRPHCQTNDHIDRVKEVLALQAQPTVVWSTALQVRVDQLGSWAYRELYWCLIYQSLREKPVNADRMEQAERLLLKFEFMEQLSLLELAAWKAVCIALPVSSGHHGPAIRDYHAWQNWMKEGWKGRKGATRYANEITIIVTFVLPFLPRPVY
jgi:hypothetical protein